MACRWWLLSPCVDLGLLTEAAGCLTVARRCCPSRASPRHRSSRWGCPSVLCSLRGTALARRVGFAAAQRDRVLELREPLGQLARRRWARTSVARSALCNAIWARGADAGAAGRRPRGIYDVRPLPPALRHVGNPRRSWSCQSDLQDCALARGAARSRPEMGRRPAHE